MDFVLEVSSLSLAVSSVSSVVIASCLVFTAEEWKTKNEGMLHLEAKRSMERKAEVMIFVFGDAMMATQLRKKAKTVPGTWGAVAGRRSHRKDAAYELHFTPNENFCVDFY